MQNISKSHILKLERARQSLQTRFHRAIAKSEETVEHIVHGTEAFASAFAFGALQGRFADRGGLGIMGVPIELVIGVGGYVAAASGVGGNASEHLYPIAQGALSAYAATLGRAIGLKMLKNTGGSPTPSLPSGAARTQVKGAEGTMEGEATLSPAELAALASPNLRK